jgi:spectinomycin phosphotransferase
MLEKPELDTNKIIECLWEEYGLSVEKICFLPLGADINTAVFRVVTSREKSYFLKLRRGEDRQQSLEYLKSNFLPNSPIVNAYQSVCFIC